MMREEEEEHPAAGGGRSRKKRQQQQDRAYVWTASVSSGRRNAFGRERKLDISTKRARRWKHGSSTNVYAFGSEEMRRCCSSIALMIDPHIAVSHSPFFSYLTDSTGITSDSVGLDEGFLAD